MALLGKLIEYGSGLTLDRFATCKLFGPLEIHNFEWVAGDDGEPSAASGLRLSLPDLAKIGNLIIEGGVYNGQAIVPGDWLRQSFEPRVTINEFIQYGYLWYIGGTLDRTVVTGVGYGGQRLTIEPQSGLMVASIAGRYNDPESWQTPIGVLFDFARPAARVAAGSGASSCI